MIACTRSASSLHVCLVCCLAASVLSESFELKVLVSGNVDGFIMPLDEDYNVCSAETNESNCVAGAARRAKFVEQQRLYVIAL